jgi:hypothetical protein
VRDQHRDAQIEAGTQESHLKVHFFSIRMVVETADVAWKTFPFAVFSAHSSSLPKERRLQRRADSTSISASEGSVKVAESKHSARQASATVHNGGLCITGLF